jgi:hypothetical protein
MCAVYINSNADALVQRETGENASVAKSTMSVPHAGQPLNTDGTARRYCRVVGALRGCVPCPAHRDQHGCIALGKPRKPHGAPTRRSTEHLSVRPLSARESIPTRRMHRKCRRTVLPNELKLASLNVRGLNRRRLDNRMKLAALIAEARRGGWHCTFLSDLHTGVDTETAVCIEEYMLLVWGRVGLLMSPEFARAWRAAGSRRFSGESDRILGISFRNRDREYVCTAVYVPHTGAAMRETRRTFW